MKFTTVSIPVGLYSDWKNKFPDIPLSQVIRCTLRNILNHKDPFNAAQFCMFGELSVQ